jgi:hypothetical protein
MQITPGVRRLTLRWPLAAALLIGAATINPEHLVAQTQPDPSEQLLFNGRDLSGWRAEGGASWTVENGLLVGRQGPDNQPGDLLTTEQFDDFELTVVFRMQWPGNSGVWYRYQSADQAYQADILEYTNPLAYSGSLYCTGKMFLARNTDPKLVRRDDWNTLLIRAVGPAHTVALNGVQVAQVRDSLCDRGRIGFQVHAGREFGPMQLQVKEIRIRRQSK